MSEDMALLAASLRRKADHRYTHAELASGDVVQMQRDCGCTHHDGPHWLHMQYVCLEMAAEAAEQGRVCKVMDLERGRLTNRLNEMQSRGIVRLSPPLEVDHELDCEMPNVPDSAGRPEVGESMHPTLSGVL